MGKLEKVDLSLSLEKKEYEKEIEKLQLRLVELQQKMRKTGLAALLAYEGWDAAGKGGSILRITEKLDPRGYQVWPIGAPNEVERKYNYLWRFWTRIPPRGNLTIFDRTWYGRVLVERVEGFCGKEDWKRAYGEIRDFERTLADDGIVLIKYWMHISKDEQLKRFKERENDPFKSWKIGPDDWRNREKWEEYEEAAEQMFVETDMPYAPWHLIPANNKHFARVRTARILVDQLERALEGQKKGK